MTAVVVYRDTDLTSRDIINSQRMAICLDEPREAQYMAGFIALQMSKMWGMFEGGEERTMNAELEGKPGCPPTSPIRIRKVYSYHQRRRKSLSQRMFGRDPSDRLRSEMNIFI